MLTDDKLGRGKFCHFLLFWTQPSRHASSEAAGSSRRGAAVILGVQWCERQLPRPSCSVYTPSHLVWWWIRVQGLGFMVSPAGAAAAAAAKECLAVQRQQLRQHARRYDHL